MPVFALKIRAERTGNDCLVESLGGRNQLRQVLVEISHLRFIERVRRIHRVADADKRRDRAQMDVELFRFEEHRLCFRKALCLAKGFVVCAVLLHRRRNIRACVREFVEFLHSIRFLSHVADHIFCLSALIIPPAPQDCNKKEGCRHPNGMSRSPSFLLFLKQSAIDAPVEVLLADLFRHACAVENAAHLVVDAADQQLHAARFIVARKL